jgi:hypothetical protein
MAERLWAAAGAALLVLAGCGRGESGPAGSAGAPAATVTATVLTFQEHDADGEEVLGRMLVTPQHLRIDDGADGESFVLLDRASRRLYSTNPVEQSVLLVGGPAPEDPPPIPLNVEQESRSLPEGPRAQGVDARHYALRVNGRDCYEVVAVPGLLPEVLAALREYRQVLADEHRRILARSPGEAREACDLAHNVFAPTAYLEHGLPIEEWDGEGYHRALVDYQEGIEVSADLFRLPPGFRQVVLGREGFD